MLKCKGYEQWIIMIFNKSKYNIPDIIREQCLKQVILIEQTVISKEIIVELEWS